MAIRWVVEADEKQTTINAYLPDVDFVNVAMIIRPSGAPTLSVSHAGSEDWGDMPMSVVAALYGASVRFADASKLTIPQHKLLLFMIENSLDIIYTIGGPGGGVTFGDDEVDAQWLSRERRRPFMHTVKRLCDLGFLDERRRVGRSDTGRAVWGHDLTDKFFNQLKGVHLATVRD